MTAEGTLTREKASGTDHREHTLGDAEHATAVHDRAGCPLVRWVSHLFV